LAFFFPAYVLAAELAKPPKTRGEILVFRRNKGSPKPEKARSLDAENQLQNRPVVAEKASSSSRSDDMVVGKDVFHWEDLCYDIETKGGNRSLLDHVDGWVKPGVSTILMVISVPNSTQARTNQGFIRGCLVQEKRPYWTFWPLVSPPVL
jgi:hypothetical protein